MIPIEDHFEDVLSKAMRGRGLTLGGLASLVARDESEIRELLAGNPNDILISALSCELGLNQRALLNLAGNPQTPDVDLPDGIELHNTPYPIPGYEEMTVNAYSISPPKQHQSFLVDAGLKFETAESFLRESQTSLGGLFLTHTHGDHVSSYDAISELAERCFSPVEEPYGSAEHVRGGDSFELGGGWSLQALSTPGHSRGGTSYLLKGSPVPVAFVGDAIFCFSIGKADLSYESALLAISEKILSLPNETILCPGHGPVTTVGHEKKNNPFFA